ncbi:MAG: hypothetical protein RLZZ524_924 [Pseudomonadota bacterium]|jgi:hypothetical protein
MRCPTDDELAYAGAAIALCLAMVIASMLLHGCSVPVRIVEANPVPVVAPEKPTSWGPNGEVRTSDPVPLPVTPYGGFLLTIPASASEPARVATGAFTPTAPVAAASLPHPVHEPDGTAWLAGLGGLAAALGLPGAGLVGWLLRKQSLLTKALDMAIAYGSEAEQVDPTRGDKKDELQQRHERLQQAAGVHSVIKARLERHNQA